MAKLDHKKVDDFAYAFPVLVRYAGLVSTLVLIGFCLAGYTAQAAPGFVAAAGMLLYKTVRDAAKEIESEEEVESIKVDRLANYKSIREAAKEMRDNGENTDDK